MAEKIRIVHYINQFFAGIGGEEEAHCPVQFEDRAKGPAIGIAGILGDSAEIVRTIWCGDNLINENQKESLTEIEKLIKEVQPDVVLAGPAFNAGRYGIACGLVGRLCRKKLSIPVLTGMFPENPAVEIYKEDVYILPVGSSAAGMRKALPVMAEKILKLGRLGKLGNALEDGYIQSGYRYNEYVEKPASTRALDMLMIRLGGGDPVTEVPLRSFEQVEPAEALADIKNATIAIVTGGGMVPAGNPDKLKQAFADAYGVYSIEGLDELPASDFKGIHGGYDSSYVDEDPDRVVPVDALRVLEKQGKFKKLVNEYFALCGIGTNVAMAKKLGAEIAEELKRRDVSAAIFTST
ncbi:MAG: glycine/betaine/sarcosine/D-proline family reductase selenoprotein B [Spirochaetales bacterium]|nr:glycine/betaine/sarcosine/D-proline family reductase selenoprotein B [Spirochaetales bacterium]